MSRYNRFLLVVPVICMLVCLFTMSASATGIETTEPVVEETTVSDVVDETTTDSSSVDLTETNTYLEYITGFLLFFVIVILLHYSYQFFKLFF